MSESTTVTLAAEELATVLAALRYYAHQGMGDPDNRPDWLQAIACPDGMRMTSLDESAISALCERINTESGRLPDGDYTLTEGSGWFAVAELYAVRINKTDEGLAVDIYSHGDELDPLASAWVLDNELPPPEKELDDS